MDAIPLTKPYLGKKELDEVKDVLDSGWVANGPKTEQFERCVANYLQVDSALAVVNCTAALHLSLLSLGVGRGDEVLVSDYTYPATAYAVLYCQAKPVFVDVDAKTYNLDTGIVKDLINDKTKAIIPVHVFGQPADMTSVVEIAKEHGLYVVEDAACALGAKYAGRYAGTFGDIGCFSFHARKGITTGEGGMIVSENKPITERARKLSMFGMSSAWDREKNPRFHVPEFDELGYNYKMSDITAAVGVAQMEKLDRIIEKKRSLACYWDNLLNEIDGITPPNVKESAYHIYQSYVPLLDEDIKRDRLIDTLRRKGVQAQIGTYCMHTQPVYGSKQECPNSKLVFERAISLPMYYSLSEEKIDHAAKILSDTLSICRN